MKLWEKGIGSGAGRFELIMPDESRPREKIYVFRLKETS